MALPFCDAQPRLFSSLHRRQTPPRTRHKQLHFATSNELRFSCSHPNFNLRGLLLPPPKSSSINGYSVQSSPEFIKDSEDAKVDRFEKVKRWIAFARSILPGGKWWNSDDDIEIRILAEPVTVFRALLKMWEMVSKDRWIIFVSFSALIVAAVSFQAHGFSCLI